MATTPRRSSRLAASSWKKDRLQGMKCAVTGAGGFLGEVLVERILECGAPAVVACDLRECSFEDKRVTSVVGDIRNLDDMKRAFHGVDVVFHVASYFGNPPFLATGFGQDELIMDINVNGTKTVVEACIQENVPRLVYTSSINVLFPDVGEMIDSKESDPYPTKFPGPYGLTKSIAEKFVLAANGSPLKSSGFLSTAAVRPNGIYGPGPKCMTMNLAVKFTSMMGGFYGSIGGLDSLSDWTYVENLAQGNILAAAKIISPKAEAAGEAFHITDGVAINNVVFMGKILQLVGWSYYPILQTPASFMLCITYLLEWVSYLLRPIVHVPVLVSTVYVKKMMKHNYVNIDKAIKVLGYSPIPMDEGIAATGKYLKEVFPAPRPVRTPALFLRLAIVLGLAFTALVASVSLSGAGEALVAAVHQMLVAATFGRAGLDQMDLVQFQGVLWDCVFVPAVTIHLVDGAFALVTAYRKGGEHYFLWFFQTVLYGSPSYFLLQEDALVRGAVLANTLAMFAYPVYSRM